MRAAVRSSRIARPCTSMLSCTNRFVWSNRSLMRVTQRSFTTPVETVTTVETTTTVETPSKKKMSKNLYRSPMRESIDDSHLPLIERSVIFEPSSHHTGTIIWLQGLGEDVDALRPLFQSVQSRSTKIIVPRANKMLITALGEKEERAWFDQLTEEMEKNMDEDVEGINESTTLVHQLIELEAAKLEKGSRGIILGGAAQGGALALHAGLAYKEPIAGIIGYSSYLACPELYPDHISEANKKTPILIIHGKNDRAIPYASFAKDRYDQLRGVGLPLELRVIFSMNEQMNTTHFVQGILWAQDKISK